MISDNVKRKFRLWFWRITWTLLCLGLIYWIQPYHVYKVSGPSMSPTLKDGDLIWVKIGKPIAVKKGHIYIFKHYDELIVKRVVNIPGDNMSLIEQKDHQYMITRDEKLVKTTQHLKLYTGFYQLDSKQIYVLGDNPPESTDSRAYGLLSTDDIEAEVLMR